MESKQATAAAETVCVEVPLAELGDCHLTRHCEARLDHRQAVALQRLHNGLDAAGARLAGGKRIYSRPDAVRWLLERIADKTERE